MKSYFEFITEDLASIVKDEPNKKASRQAKRLGLTYLGFGRYGDREGKVAYVAHNDELVPYKTGKELDKVVSKSFEKEEPGLRQAAVHASSVVKNRTKEDAKVLKKDAREVDKTHRQLSNFGTTLGPEEQQSVQAYTSDWFDHINSYVMQGFPEGTDANFGNQVQAHVQNLDNAFSKSAAPFDYTSYVSLSPRYKAEDFEVGKDYVFNNYLSSTLDHKVALSAEHGGDSKSKSKAKVLLQLNVKQGQPAIYTSVLGNEDKETLHPRGSRIRIKSAPQPLSMDSLNGSKPSEDKVHLIQAEIV